MLLVPGDPRRRDDRPPMRHLSLIRSFHLADVLTLANGACGMTAVLYALAHATGGWRGGLGVAAGLVLLALVFDVFDGRVARWRQQHSVFGRELDSLADLVSFGVAPATIAFAAGLDTWPDAAVLVFFVLCGLSRLARYNVTAEALSTKQGRVTHFEGTPIPTSVVPLGILMWGVEQDWMWAMRWGGTWLHVLVLPFFVSGCLMVSRTLRIPKP